MSRMDVDEVDRAILQILTVNGRSTLTEIAERVNLSPAPVKRRIERLERSGVITGYTVVVDQSVLNSGFEAFVELRFLGNTKVPAITASVVAVPEVDEVFTVAGDPDALVRIHVDSVQHLQQVVDRLRRSGQVIGTKTLMIVGSWSRRAAATQVAARAKANRS